MFESSELILNQDGSIYHLNLLPEDIADTIITVGDPDRVEKVSKHFDSIEVKKQKREFCTHTGYIGEKRISVISSGIGTDNIDIVLNEIDAIVNFDLKTKTIKKDLKSLKFIRIGTSGTLQKDIPVDSILLSSYGLGLDGLMNFYKNENTVEELEFINQLKRLIPNIPIEPKITACSSSLLKSFESIADFKGITISATGFYGPQGRKLRAQLQVEKFIEKMESIKLNEFNVTNLEMETAAIYGLGKILNHKCLSINLILANRVNKTFSSNPKEQMENAIVKSLEKIEEIA